MKTNKERFLGVVTSLALTATLVSPLCAFAEGGASSVTVSGVSHSKPTAVTNVASDELIKIKFSGNIMPESVEVGDVTAVDTTGGEINVTPVQIDSTTVGIYPGELLPQKTYTVKVSGVLDESGAAIAEYASAESFKTADNLAPASYAKGKILTNAASGKAVTVYSAADGSVSGTLTGLTDNDRCSSMTGANNTIPGTGSYTVLDLGKETSIASLVISTTATDYHSDKLDIYGANDISSITSAQGIKNANFLKKLTYADANGYVIENWYRQYHFKTDNGSYRYLIFDGPNKISPSYFGEIYVYEQTDDLLHDENGILRTGVKAFSDFPAYENSSRLKIENITDGSSDTYWFTNSTNPYPYFIIDLGGLKNIKKIACLPANGYNPNVAGGSDGGNYFRDNYIIKVSNSTDINEAVTVKQGAPTVAVGEWIEAVLNGDNVYRYVIVAKPGGGFFGATEMKVYGSEPLDSFYGDTKVSDVTYSNPGAVTNVESNELIKINFSGDVDAATAVKGNISAVAQDGKVTYVNPIILDSKTIGIYPGDLALQTTYNIYVTEMKDANGSYIKPYKSTNTFTTTSAIAKVGYEADKVAINAAAGKTVTTYNAQTGEKSKTLSGLTDEVWIGSTTSENNKVLGSGYYTVLDLGREVAISDLMFTTNNTIYHIDGLKIYGANDITSITSGQGIGNADLLKTISFNNDIVTNVFDTWWRYADYQMDNALYRYLILDGNTKISESYFGEICVYEKTDKPVLKLSVDGTTANANVLNRGSNMLLLAAYQNGVLVNVVIKKDTDEAALQLTEQMTEIKAFVWDNNFSPAVKAKTITITNTSAD